MEFQYNLPVNLIFGRGKSGSIGEVAAKYGKKILVVTGTGSTKRSGLLDRTVLCLKQAGVESNLWKEKQSHVANYRLVVLAFSNRFIVPHQAVTQLSVRTIFHSDGNGSHMSICRRSAARRKRLYGIPRCHYYAARLKG